MLSLICRFGALVLDEVMIPSLHTYMCYFPDVFNEVHTCDCDWLVVACQDLCKKLRAAFLTPCFMYTDRASLAGERRER